VVKYIDLTSLGTLNASLVHPREVFRLAVMQGIASVILGHNHPSGSTEPSEEDLRITRRLVEAGKILGIEILDHVIIADNTYLSFKAQGLF
jgi:DNA repair protein RadC